MPDFIDRLATDLVRVATADLTARATPDGGPRRRRRPKRRARRLLVAPAIVLLGGGIAVAGTAVLTGAPDSPQGPTSSVVGNGAPTGADTLPISVADPVGGLPWGMRTVRTNRGELCVQVGRLDDGQIGVFGQDGAFDDDGLFHPFAADAEDPNLGTGGCVTLDVNGRAYTNVAVTGLPLSASSTSGCLTRPTSGDTDACPVEDLRDIYYGLLGPDAATVTYKDADGSPVMVRTVGASGAYLIVTPVVAKAGYAPEGGGMTTVGLAKNGPILAVTYRDGSICRPTPKADCPAVGFDPVAGPRDAEVAAAVRGALTPSASGSLLTIAYTARIAVDTAGSFYYVSLEFPSGSACPGDSGTGTSANIRSGQLVTYREQIPAGCHGTITGVVRYHPASAIHSAAPAPQVNPGDLTVGRFTVQSR